MDWNQFTHFFQQHQIITKILIFMMFVIVGFLIVRILLRIIRKLILKTKVDHTVKTFLFSCTKVLLYFIVIMLALANAGIDVTSVIASVGAALLALSFALQNTLSNFFSGIILLFTKPFTADDLIEFDGHEGFVINIKMFYTTIRTFDNKMVKIPNSKLTSNSVVNCSVGELRRVKNVYSVSYDDNITKVRSVILNVVSQNDLIVTDPEPKVYVSNHLDSGVEITVFTWGEHEDYYPILFYMEENVKRAFDENGITIPYPHVVVKK